MHYYSESSLKNTSKLLFSISGKEMKFGHRLQIFFVKEKREKKKILTDTGIRLEHLVASAEFSFASRLKKKILSHLDKLGKNFGN